MLAYQKVYNDVAPRVGAWIETAERVPNVRLDTSHPVWVRGLKLIILYMCFFSVLVAPRVGAWIETPRWRWSSARAAVAPRVGAWIETRHQRKVVFGEDSRTPCGCVD